MTPTEAQLSARLRLADLLDCLDSAPFYRVEGFAWHFGWVHESSEKLDDSDRKEISLPSAWCGTVGCALGFAEFVKLDNLPNWLADREVTTHLGVSFGDFDQIFYSPELYGCDRYEDVTPGMVAAKLREGIE